MSEDLLIPNNQNPIFMSNYNTNSSIGNPKWKILIADDEADVHIMTKMILKKFEYDGRKLEFLSSYSGAETIEIMKNNPDTAIVLLDVVMEKNNSGLEVVRRIREELINPFVRIILRTGQPGQAPEEEVIRNYDINDYKSKTELTVQKLYTSIIASLRAFKDMRTIETSRIGLDNIIKFTRELFTEKNIAGFSEVALTKIIQLLDINTDIEPYKSSGFIGLKLNNDIDIIAADGEYINHKGLSISLTEPRDFILNNIDKIKYDDCFFDNEKLLAKYKVSDKLDFILYLEGNRSFNVFDRNMIQTFSTNLSTGLNNIILNDEIIDTQREVIFTLGEIVETRSKETANHVRRVAEFSYVLGIASGLNEKKANVLRFASPMHDIGKIGIPDNILNKPGRLTEEEFEVIKGHTKIGHDILKTSKREIMKAAAIIAMQHHERWDGTGYPNKISGDNIHIFARITSVADVFDALGHKRVYKDAWKEQEIIDYMKDQSGKMFDPNIVNLLLENLDEIKNIKHQFPD